MIEQTWFLFVVAGLIGGLARAFFGLYKAINDGYEINFWYFIVTMFASGLIGAILGTLFEVDYRFAALMGYVGTDILENIVKNAMPGTVTVNR